MRFDDFRMRTADGRYEWFIGSGSLWYRNGTGFGWLPVVCNAGTMTKPDAEAMIDAHMTETATRILTGAA